MSKGQTEPLVTGDAFGLSRHFHLVTFLPRDFVCLLKHGPFLLLNAKADLNYGQLYLAERKYMNSYLYNKMNKITGHSAEMNTSCI